MMKFSNIQPVILGYCSSLFRMPIRTKKMKAETKVVVRKWSEDKQLYGPLLKKRKKGKKTKKHSEKSITSLDTTNQIDKNNDRDDNPKSSELNWTVRQSNPKWIHLFTKKDSDMCHSVVESEPTLRPPKIKNQVSNVLVFDKNNFNSITIDETDNQVLQNAINNVNIENSKIMTSEKLDNNKDAADTINSLIRLNDSINIPMELKIGYETKNFPLINTVKSDEDQWEDSQILSRTTIERKDIILPGVTRILNATMSDESKMFLDKWKQKMILGLGEEGFENYMKDQKESSKLMHSIIYSTLQNELVEIPNYLQDTFRSINLILKNVKNVRLLESHVIHSDLRYRGIVDCVANYQGNLCLIDWKKSDKIKTLNTIYDLPLQLSAYVGALNSDPNYPFKVKMAVLAIAYSSGRPPSVFEFPESKLNFYWKEWLKRLEKYYLMKP